MSVDHRPPGLEVSVTGIIYFHTRETQAFQSNGKPWEQLGRCGLCAPILSCGGAEAAPWTWHWPDWESLPGLCLLPGVAGSKGRAEGTKCHVLGGDWPSSWRPGMGLGSHGLLHKKIKKISSSLCSLVRGAKRPPPITKTGSPRWQLAGGCPGCRPRRKTRSFELFFWVSFPRPSSGKAGKRQRTRECGGEPGSAQCGEGSRGIGPPGNGVRSGCSSNQHPQGTRPGTWGLAVAMNPTKPFIPLGVRGPLWLGRLEPFKGDGRFQTCFFWFLF